MTTLTTTATVRAYLVKSRLTIVGAVVGIILVLITGIVILAGTGENISAGAKQVIITTLLANVFTVIPAILALSKTEQVHHDLKNGLIEDKVSNALESHGVVTRDGPAVDLTMRALTTLLEQNQRMVQQNTQVTTENTELIRNGDNDG